MNRLLFSEGGQPVCLDDLKLLQDNEQEGQCLVATECEIDGDATRDEVTTGDGIGNMLFNHDCNYISRQ